MFPLDLTDLMDLGKVPKTKLSRKSFSTGMCAGTRVEKPFELLLKVEMSERVL